MGRVAPRCWWESPSRTVTVECSPEPLDDLSPQYNRFQYLDMRRQRQYVGGRLLDRPEPKGRLHPPLLVGRAASSKRLEAAEHCGSSSPLVGDANDRPAGRTRTPTLRFPSVRLGERSIETIQQLEAAAGAPNGIDRHAGAGELLDVTQDGAFADLEFSGETGGRDTAMPLQQQHERHQPTGTHAATLCRSANSRQEMSVFLGTVGAS